MKADPKTRYQLPIRHVGKTLYLCSVCGSGSGAHNPSRRSGYVPTQSVLAGEG